MELAGVATEKMNIHGGIEKLPSDHGDKYSARRENYKWMQFNEIIWDLTVSLDGFLTRHFYEYFSGSDEGPVFCKTSLFAAIVTLIEGGRV